MAAKYPVCATNKNWSDAIWKLVSDDSDTTEPTSGDNVQGKAGTSFPNPGVTLTATTGAVCGALDCTNWENNPVLALGNIAMSVYGARTFIAAMTVTAGTGSITYKNPSGTVEITNNAMPSYVPTIWNGAGTFHLADDQNCSFWTYTAGTFSANTATVNINGTGTFAGGNVDYGNACTINLTGSSHTTSGNFSCGTFTYHPTSHTNANVLTVTSGSVISCTDYTIDGGTRATQILVQGSVLGGTPGRIWPTNPGTVTSTDFMDMNMSGDDFSAQTDIGDCGGNINITFPAAAPQTWDGTTGSASNAAKWTARVPLVGIDDATIPTAGITFTDDMPRMAKSRTYTGTGTVTGAIGINIYGNFTLATGMTYSGITGHSFRGRGNYVITTNGVTIAAPAIRCPGGTYTLGSDLTFTGAPNNNLEAGGFNSSIYNVTGPYFVASTTDVRSLNMGSGTWTLNRTTAGNKWLIDATNLTFTAGTSTIVCTSTAANAQNFIGGGLTYNNVTVTGAGAYALTVSGNNTFNTITNDSSVAVKTITGTAGSVQTIAHLVLKSGPGKVAVFNSTGAAWTITGQSGVFEGNYMSITNVVAGKTNTYYAGNNSTNGGGNTNWIFGRRIRAVWIPAIGRR